MTEQTQSLFIAVANNIIFLVVLVILSVVVGTAVYWEDKLLHVAFFTDPKHDAFITGIAFASVESLSYCFGYLGYRARRLHKK